MRSKGSEGKGRDIREGKCTTKISEREQNAGKENLKEERGRGGKKQTKQDWWRTEQAKERTEVHKQEQNEGVERVLMEAEG